MTLSGLFLSCVLESLRPHVQADPDLEATLRMLAEQGQSAWPALRIEATDFVFFLGHCLAEEEDASDLRTLRAADLHLICAYGLEVPGADHALENHHMRRVDTALKRIGTPASVIADILQDLRQRLVEMGNPQRERRGYAGRGDLTAWLCVVAVREAGRRRERNKKDLSLEMSSGVRLTSPDDSPELAYLRRTYEREFQEAFQAALGSLSSRERNILRYHFVDGLSIDRIGDFYGVHRATAARWLNRAREALCLMTREILGQRISLSQDGFRRMLSLIESQISVRLVLAQVSG